MRHLCDCFRLIRPAGLTRLRLFGKAQLPTSLRLDRRHKLALSVTVSSPQDAPKPISSDVGTELFQNRSSTEHDVDLSEEGRKDVSILVAEDNIINQRIALKMLKQQGFSASAVCNGKEALEYLMAAANGEHAVPNIILMDVQMPVMDGYQATQTIRTQASFRDWPQIRNIPIIGVSEFETECDREKCLASGMDDFLSKPLEFESLEKTLFAWATVGERDLATPSNFRQARKHAGRPNCFPGHVGPSQSSQVPPTLPYLPAFGFPNSLQSQFTPMETPRGETEYPFPHFEAEPNFIGETSFTYPGNGTMPASQSDANQVRATAKASLAGILSPESTQRQKGKQKQSELPSTDKLDFDVESWFTQLGKH